MDIQTISVVIAAIGVLIAAVNQVYTSRQANQQRQLQLFMGIYDRFHADDFTKAQMDAATWELNDLANIKEYADFMQWISDNPDRWSQLWKLSKYYEGVGILVTRGLFNLDLVEDLMGKSIVDFWAKFKPVFEKLRVHLDPRQSNSIEVLYDAVINMRIKKRSQILSFSFSSFSFRDSIHS